MRPISFMTIEKPDWFDITITLTLTGHPSVTVKANVLQTTRATVSAFRTRSVRALFLLDAECQCKCRLDGVCHGIYLPDEECQGI